MSLHPQSNLFNHKRGPGFWKFNTALFRDETYVTALKMNLPSFKEKYKEIHDLGLKWDLIKMEIRGFTLQYSKRKAKQSRDEEKYLYKKVNDLQANAERNPHDKSAILELQLARARLRKITLIKTKGAILRSKARWHAPCEQSLLLSFSFLRRRKGGSA